MCRYFLHLIFTFQGVSILQAQALLDYVYNGKVVVRKEELGGFMKLARDLRLKGLLDYKEKEEVKNGESPPS